MPDAGHGPYLTRILSVYGPHDGPATMISGTIRKLLHGEKPALTAGIQQWDYLYAADAAAAFYALAVSGQDGRVYPLGSGTARPLKDYIGGAARRHRPALPLGLGEVPTARCRYAPAGGHVGLTGGHRLAARDPV